MVWSGDIFPPVCSLEAVFFTTAPHLLLCSTWKKGTTLFHSLKALFNVLPGTTTRFQMQTRDSYSVEVNCANAVVYNLHEELGTCNLNDVLAVF